jgi:hypothetical protein
LWKDKAEDQRIRGEELAFEEEKKRRGEFLRILTFPLLFSSAGAFYPLHCLLQAHPVVLVVLNRMHTFFLSARSAFSVLRCSDSVFFLSLSTRLSGVSFVISYLSHFLVSSFPHSV